MNHLTIIRGVSGSGKSTLAQQIVRYNVMNNSYAEYYEADMWFIRENNEYRFDALSLEKAHAWCRLMVELCIRRGINVVVSNTFTRRNELKPYIELALRYQVPLSILETSTDWCRDPHECARKNIHGLSFETVQKQIARWEHVIPKVYEGKILEKLLRECSK